MVVVVVVVMVIVVVVVPADYSCRRLALGDQSGSRRPGGLPPCRTGLVRAAVLAPVSFIWFHHQLGAVRRRGADLLSRRRGLLVVQVVVTVLIFGDFRGLWKLSGLWWFAVFLVIRVVAMEMVVMLVVAVVMMVVVVIVVAWLLVVLHHNSPDAIQAHVL